MDAKNSECLVVAVMNVSQFCQVLVCHILDVKMLTEAKLIRASSHTISNLKLKQDPQEGN